MLNNRKQKEIEYGAYIAEHIKNVQKVWAELRGVLEFDEETQRMMKAMKMTRDDILAMIDTSIQKHDASKYSTVEFNGYRRKFFPMKDEKSPKFKYAWNAHLNGNKHHWQYWVMYEPTEIVALEIPFRFIVEMVCDWTAMSIKFKNVVSEWYEGKKDEILFTNATRETVEKLLPEMDKIIKKLVG